MRECLLNHNVGVLGSLARPILEAAPEAMNSNLRTHASEDTQQGQPIRLAVTAAHEDELANARQSFQQLDGPAGKRDAVFTVSLRALGWNGPDGAAEVELGPPRTKDFSAPGRRENGQLQRPGGIVGLGTQLLHEGR